MKKLISLTMILILLLVPVNIAAGDINIIFMEKAVSDMKNHNNTLLNMAESERTTRKQYDKAVTSAKNIDTEGVTVEFFGEEMYIHFDTNTKMMLTLQKELFPEQMKLSWEMTRDTRKVTLNSMTTGLRELYLGLYTTDNDCNIKQRRYELAQTIYEQSKIKFERGMITEIDLEEAEYNCLKEKAAYNAAKRNKENILRSLNSFIGIMPDTEYDRIIYEEMYNENSLKECEYYLERAFANRLEVIGAAKQIALMESKQAIMEKYPYSIQLPSNKKDYEALLVELESQKLMLERAKLDIEKNIKGAYIEVSEADRNVIGVKKMLDLQKTNLENMKQKHETGMISKTLLDQIQIGYDEVENGYKSALFDYNTKLMKLEYAAGIGPAY